MTKEGNGKPVTFKIGLSDLVTQEINQLKKELSTARERNKRPADRARPRDVP
jgi:hypothetical protein